jgi:hypothetical protein
MSTDYAVSQVDDGYLDAIAAAGHLSDIYDCRITPAMIRKWASRGKIRKSDRSGRFRTYSMISMYEYADSLYG